MPHLIDYGDGNVDDNDDNNDDSNDDGDDNDNDNAMTMKIQRQRQ